MTIDPPTIAAAASGLSVVTASIAALVGKMNAKEIKTARDEISFLHNLLDRRTKQLLRSARKQGVAEGKLKRSPPTPLNPPIVDRYEPGNVFTKKRKAKQ